jgi:hypothetical protein
MSASESNDLIRSQQVSPLPIGPGGNNAIKNQLNSLNTTLTMTEAQSRADKRFDPPVPNPITQSSIKESFCSIPTISTTSTLLASIGILCIVYGIVAK